MKRKIVCLLILSSLLLSMEFASWASSLLSTSVIFAEKPWMIVPDQYPTIQAAIDTYRNNIHAGILVRKNSTYTENIVIDVDIESGLVLMGEARESTIINGNGATAVIRVEVSNVTITGFTVSTNDSQKSDDACGVLISSSYCNITGNI